LDTGDEPLFGGRIFELWLAIHLMGWVSQFVGHGIFEQRAPALVSNLFYIFLAPFFVNFEYVNYLFGYRQEDKEACDKLVFADIAHFRKKTGKPPMKRD